MTKKYPHLENIMSSRNMNIIYFYRILMIWNLPLINKNTKTGFYVRQTKEWHCRLDRSTYR